MDILKLLPVFVLILSSFGIPMPMINAEDVTETFEGVWTYSLPILNQ